MFGRLRDTRGQAAVEMVVILPLMLALCFGLVEVGKAFFYWIDQTHLAGDAGRFAATDTFPGCAPPPATGLCNGQSLVGFVTSSTDTKELANSSNATEENNCTINQGAGDSQTPTNTKPGEVPCKLRVLFCYPAGQPNGVNDPAPGQPGYVLRVTIQSIYRIKALDAALNLVPGPSIAHPDIKVRGTSTVRLEQPLDLTRLGVASIPTCT